MTDDELQGLLVELRDELRRARQQGLVVRLPDAQIDEISYRVLERVDERLASQPAPDETAPSRPQPSRLRLPRR